MDFIKEKVEDELGDAMVEFIQASPLIILSTIDSSGNIDSSPKGDAAGFVSVENSRRLLIPDRPGNKLAYGFRNLMDNGKIGLLFVMPNMRETLRVKGTATISRDPLLLENLSAQGKPALLCTIVDIEECFFHCGKRFFLRFLPEFEVREILIFILIKDCLSTPRMFRTKVSKHCHIKISLMPEYFCSFESFTMN